MEINSVMKQFEGNNVTVKMINGESMFEIYSTGMALGFVTKAKEQSYPHKIRINKILKNAEISTVVHGGTTFITESQLYDFMLEAKTEKCKPFRKWVVTEVLPSIRKHGMYATEVTVDSMIADPDFAIKLLTELKEERLKTNTLRKDSQ